MLLHEIETAELKFAMLYVSKSTYTKSTYECDVFLKINAYEWAQDNLYIQTVR